MKKTIPWIFIAVVACIVGGCANVNVKTSATRPADSNVQARQERKGWFDSLFGTEQTVFFFACDALALPDQQVALVATVKKQLDGIEHVAVGFYDDGNNLVGSAETNDDGHASITWPGGQAGDYRFTARIMDCPVARRKKLPSLAPAEFLVAVRAKSTPIVVIDLDRTIVDSSFWQVLRDRAVPMESSLEVSQRIARSYTIVYLTHRPDMLIHKTKAWLKANGYPAAPLLTCTMKLLVTESSAAYKKARLAQLRRVFPNTSIGIGDKIADAQAYVENGMTAYLIPHYKTNAKDMRKLAGRIRELKDGPNLQVVANWRQIEQGIFEGRHFPPQEYADWLTAQANALEKGKKGRL